jgi:uracil-DNA glycosylase
MREAVQECQGCDLYRNATQAVFGLGSQKATVMLVGEQPGDQEDREGLPFVGPAGRMLGKALVDVGLEREGIYITNAVKHFKWQPRGKRRIHQTPRASEVRACRPWLEAEIDIVRPALIACLGATAVSALLKSDAKVMSNRGQVIESVYGPCLVMVHPSAILRVDPGDRDAAYAQFVQDLHHGVEFLQRSGALAR